MTERKPAGVGFESWVDQQIREAADRGEFDDLPGAGKPLPDAGGPDDENWWLRGYLRRENVETDVLLPVAMRLRKRIERLPETVRALRSESEVRAAVARLNAEIRESWRTATGPLPPVRLVDADTVVARWHADRAAADESAAAEPAGPPPARRPPWWRRMLQRDGR
jgi:hypothetical protein